MRRVLLGMTLAALVSLVAVETASAQFFYGRGGRGGGTSYGIGIGTPGFAFSYGRGNPGWGGWYGPNWYGGGWGSPFVGNNLWYNSGWYGRSNYGGWYNSYPSSYYSTPLIYSTPTYSSTGSYSTSSPYYWDYGAGSNYTSSTPSSGIYRTDSSFAAGMPQDDYRSYYAGPGGRNDQVLLQTILPDPQARVWIQDQLMQQMGTERRYVSPPLEEGTYTYTVRASWMENGREVSRERKVRVEPGQQYTVNFLLPQRDDNPSTTTDSKPGVGQENRGGGTEVDRRESGNGQLREQPKGEQARRMMAKVVRVEEGQLVVTMNDGGEERTFRLADDAQITLNNNKAEVKSLAAGTQVVITTRPGSPLIATQVQAFTDAEKRP